MDLLVVLAAFVAMEPATYLAHRFVMHGPGMVWHASHHRPAEGRFEANDLFPVCFGALTVLAITAGFNLDSLRILLPIGAGVTLYGLAYTIVHEGIIHRRFRMPGTGAIGRFWADSHELHHRFGGEPYGMLLPIVPAALRARGARSAGRRPLARTVERVDAAPGA